MVIRDFGRSVMDQTSEAGSTIRNTDALAPFRSMFAMFPRIQASAADMILKQQKELFEFLAHRCERDLEFVERLRNMDDVSKLPSLFSTFMQGASQDYAEEAS
jgi:hypothetical protein